MQAYAGYILWVGFAVSALFQDFRFGSVLSVLIFLIYGSVRCIFRGLNCRFGSVSVQKIIFYNFEGLYLLKHTS